MLGRRRRRRANIEPTFVQCLVFAGTLPGHTNLMYTLARLSYAILFHPLEAVSRYCDPQLQVSGTNIYLLILDQTFAYNTAYY